MAYDTVSTLPLRPRAFADVPPKVLKAECGAQPKAERALKKALKHHTKLAAAVDERAEIYPPSDPKLQKLKKKKLLARDLVARLRRTLGLPALDCFPSKGA